MGTQVIVQPGRCVMHEGRRRIEGAVLNVCAEDLKDWERSGDVKRAVFIGVDPADQVAASASGTEGLAGAYVGAGPIGDDDGSQGYVLATATDEATMKTIAATLAPALQALPGDAGDVDGNSGEVALSSAVVDVASVAGGQASQASDGQAGGESRSDVTPLASAIDFSAMAAAATNTSAATDNADALAATGATDQAASTAKATKQKTINKGTQKAKA